MKKYDLFIFCNLIFLIYALITLLGNNIFILSLLINLIMFVIPGLGWIGVFKKRIENYIILLFFIICLSTFILFLGWGGHSVLGIEETAFTNFVFLILVTNIGIILTKQKGVLNFKVTSWEEIRYIAIFSSIIYVLLFLGAAILPVFRDYDWEVSSPSYSLISNVKSYATVNAVKDDFALHHPLLRDFYVGYAMIMSRIAERTFFYYETIFQIIMNKIKFNETRYTNTIVLKDPRGGRAELEIRKKDGGVFEVEGELPSGNEMKFELRKNPKAIKLPFLSPWYDDYHLNVRMINTFLGVLIFLIIYHLVFYLTGSSLISLSASLLNFSFPVVFIEYSVSSRTAISTVFLLFMIYFYILYDNKKDIGKDFLGESYLGLVQFAAGFLAALCDHKTIIFPIAIVIKEMFFLDREQRYCHRFMSKSGQNIIFGFLLGTLVWWIYGFSISPVVFIREHFQEHLFYRILQLGRNHPYYNSLQSLWLSFFEHVYLLPFMVAAMIFLFWKRISSKEAILLFWFFVGAVAFSIVDYRQVQHLILILPALIVSSANFITLQKGAVRFASLFLVFLIILYNAWNIAKISFNFVMFNPPIGW